MATPSTMTNGQMDNTGGSVHAGPGHAGMEGAASECGTREDGEGSDEEMQWRAVVEYDGSNFSGFQRQGKEEFQLLRGSNGLHPTPLQSYDFRDRAMRSVIDSGLVGSTDFSGGVPREQKMLKGRLSRVIYHQVY